jgi:hypothetical protein
VITSSQRRSITLTGCMKTNVINIAPNAQPGAEHVVWTHNAVFGLISLGDVDTKDYCPPGEVYSVETKTTFVNGLIGGITFNLYNPITAVITCKA